MSIKEGFDIWRSMTVALVIEKSDNKDARVVIGDTDEKLVSLYDAEYKPEEAAAILYEAYERER